VPTLFQSLRSPWQAALRERIRPIFSADMERANLRARALLRVFQNAGWPSDTALVIDAPGPVSVAFAAGLAGRFAPVFDFDNWPYPKSVVPAHETLGAALYFLSVFEAADQQRPDDAPPMFVLDSNRFLPYDGDGDRFDNRYFARIPSALRMKALGVRHLLYVRDEVGEPLEDVPLLDLEEEGVDVKLLTMSDFIESSEARGSVDLAEPCSEDGRCYYYGGDWEYENAFWQWYGWYLPAIELATLAPPEHCSGGYAYRPSTRIVNLGRVVGPARAQTLFPGGIRGGSLGRFHPPVWTGG
jgi:hypothetical protein